MAPQVAVQKTFIHLVDNDEEQGQQSLVRSVTAPVAKKVDLIEDVSTDEEDFSDEPVCISREITFDAFEMPCNLGDDVPCDGSGRPEEEKEEPQPQICRSKTFDPFEADVQDEMPLAPSQPNLLAPQTCTFGVVLPHGVPLQAAALSMPAAGSMVQMVDQPCVQADVLRKTLDVGVSASSRQIAPDVSCTYLPEGVVRMQWEADSRRFAGRSATAVSPAFSVEVPGLGPQTFKIVLHAAVAHGAAKRHCNFQAVGGHGTIELKCESQVPDDTYVVVVDRVEGAQLGMDLESRTGVAWRVKAIGDGLIEQWNQEHQEQREMRVSPGDSILEVNGVSGDLAKVREACAQRGSLRLVMRRASQAAPTFDVRFGVGGGAVAAQPMRGPVRHDFAAESCCGLPAGGHVWDLLSAADRAVKKVRVVCELAHVQPLAS